MVLILTVLIGLAAFRASRFIARDTLINPLRHRFFRRFPPDEHYARHYRVQGENGKPSVWQVAGTVEESGRKTSWIGRLLACGWCSSVYFSAALTAITTRYTSVPLPGLVWGASCAVAGLGAVIDQ